METGHTIRRVGTIDAPIATWALIATLYLAASVFDRSLVFFATQISAIPLAGGFAFVAVFRLGAPGGVMVFVISLAVSAWVGANTFDALVWSSFDTLNGVLGVILMRKVVGVRDPFGTTRAVLGFVLFAACLPFALTSLAGRALAYPVDFGAPDSLLIWWLGGAIGCIVSAPFLKTLSIRPSFRRKTVETVLLLSVSFFLALTFAEEQYLASDEFPLQYLVFPLLLWAVFRSGLGVAVIILVISIIATLWGTTEGFGPFVRDSVAETSLLLQAFFGVTGVTVLILHAALAERRDAEQEVRAAHDELEVRVAERTADLQDATREAEEANKTKSRFLAAASHDLRQPIHAISLFSAALQARLKTFENAKLVSKVQGSLTSLSGMLDGLLDMSRLENHAIVPHIHDFPVQSILDEIITEHGPAAEAKSLDLRVVPSSVILKSDQALLSRIMGNFVTNAIRYTDHGRVLVGCRLHGDTVRLEVWDSGEGISADELKHIFDPYHRLEGGRKQAAGGLGLGLAISDGLAGLLDHRVSVRSAAGVGSTFAVEVPTGSDVMDTSGEKFSTSSYTGAFQGYTVLTIDDDTNVLDGMQTVLTDWGCRVVVARDAASALREARALGDEIDVVISDYHLSEHDTGISVMESITQEIGREIPAIIISGDTQQERRQEVEAAGYFLLTKPVQLVSLRPLLRRQLRLRA